MNDSYILARMRAQRASAAPDDPADLARLLTATSRAGRRLVKVNAIDGAPALAMTWLDGYEPLPWNDSGSAGFRTAPPVVLITLAACLGCCWQSPDKPLYPGNDAAEDELFNALDALGPMSGIVHSDDASLAGVRSQQKSALRLLRACGFVEMQEGRVRLGPAMALWSESSILELRRNYALLPGAQ
jgi:hypothetical protein